MNIRRGEQLIESGTKQAIIEFEFINYVIFVFQGSLSEYDIVIKYKKDGTRIRTPKHIHWVVDVLMKMQGDEILAKEFLEKINECWNNCRPLLNNDFETLKTLIEEGEARVDTDYFAELNAFGEYEVDFLYVLMQLLATQEKTNREDAYMFGSIIEQLLEADRDIFKIVSTAGFGGRR